ncbi:MAG: DNA repair protein RadC [Chloroflexi bacterium]|nr:DNA repair protein RadC [Chloroflexota bacterium]
MVPAQSVNYHPMIRDLPARERPRERLRDSGAVSLSNAELLAIVLRTGASEASAVDLANQLLVRFGGLDGLAKAGFVELCVIRGLGEAKAAQVKAALELGRRLLSSQPEERPVVKSPGDVFLLLGEMSLLDQEELRVLLLNTKNQVLATHQVYRGNVNTSLIRVSELFRMAVRENCPAIIVAHNHPSGDPAPSPEDVEVTRDIVKGGQLLNIEVLDHIIIGRQGYVSLKERGLGFP